jgi:hypothetical protein
MWQKIFARISTFLHEDPCVDSPKSTVINFAGADLWDKTIIAADQEE